MIWMETYFTKVIEPESTKPTSWAELRNGPNALKRIFSKSHFSHHVQANLGQKFISLLIDEYHDNDTTMSVLRRLNVLQLENLLAATKKREASFDIALKDEYIVTYRDFFLFPEFFDYFTLHSLELLSKLDKCLFNLGSTRDFCFSRANVFPVKSNI